MEVVGKIKMIGEVQTFNNSFKKREVVVTTDEQYPQMLSIEFIQDKVDLLANFKPGQQVKISINLRGREWISPQGEAKYFNTIQGWRIENLAQTPPSQNNLPPVEQFETTDDFLEDEPDDLPF